MHIQIKNRWTGSVIHEGDYASVSKAVELAFAQCANLRGADLSDANLRDANLSGADLSDANLRRANLSGADLSGADLSDADLRVANLSGADLRGTDLSDANLRVANLSGADLRGTDLSDANLRRANLRGANLSGADLSDADLRVANLSGAKIDLSDRNTRFLWIRTRILPDGDIFGWKKAKNDSIVQLLIPAEAKRSHAFGRKCRAEFADVVAIFDRKGKRLKTASTYLHGPKTIYRVGERVQPDKWDDDWRNECSHGIHFFITREEAEAY